MNGFRNPEQNGRAAVAEGVANEHGRASLASGTRSPVTLTSNVVRVRTPAVSTATVGPSRSTFRVMSVSAIPSLVGRPRRGLGREGLATQVLFLRRDADGAQGPGTVIERATP